MESKHTQGIPWQIEEDEDGNYEIINESWQVSIAKVYRYDRDEQARANAKLIAASPDLLEALQLILNGVGLKDSNCFHNGKHIERIIREAIKKATC